MFFLSVLALSAFLTVSELALASAAQVQPQDAGLMLGRRRQLSRRTRHYTRSRHGKHHGSDGNDRQDGKDFREHYSHDKDDREDGNEREATPAYGYFSYYPTDACDNFIGVVVGWVSGEPFSFHASGVSSTCAEESVCAMDSRLDSCESVGQDVLGVIDDDGNRLYCLTTDELVGHDECTPSQGGCFASDTFPCHVRDYTLDELKADPASFFSNSNPSALKNFAYLGYYSDDACQDLEGLRGYLSGTHNVLPVVDDQVSCSQAMACFINPEGKLCESVKVKPEQLNRWNITTTGTNGQDKVSCYQDSNVCIYNQSGCFKSQVFPCYFKWITGSRLAESPSLLISDQ